MVGPVAVTEKAAGWVRLTVRFVGCEVMVISGSIDHAKLLLVTPKALEAVTVAVPVP